MDRSVPKEPPANYTHIAAAVRDAASAFVEAMDEQGRHQKSYWFYSYKAGSYVTVHGDVAFIYSVLDEIDPDVARVEIESPSTVAKVDGEFTGTRFDTRVFYRGGKEEWREYKRHRDVQNPSTRVKSQLAAQAESALAAGASYVLRDERGLVGRYDEFLNALEILGWRNRARGISSLRESVAIDEFFERCDCAPLNDLISLNDLDPAGLLCRIAERLSDGTISADLTKPLTRVTLLRRGSRQASTKSDGPTDRSKISQPRLPPRGNFEGIATGLLDMNRWTRPYEGAMRRPDDYRPRKLAIELYYDGASDKTIRDQTKQSVADVERWITLCATDDGSGHPTGFVALVPGYLRGYRRTAPSPDDNLHDPSRGGFSGLFEKLLSDFPGALEILVDATLELAKPREVRVKRPTWSSVRESLLKYLRNEFKKVGRAQDSYPFSTADTLYASVRKFCKDLLRGNDSRWIAMRKGRESMKRSQLGRGHSPLVQATRACQFGILDFHKVDALSSIEVDTPGGGALQAVLPRWWIGRILCPSTRAALSTTLSLQRNTTKECVLDLVDALVRPPLPRESLKSFGTESSGDWQPNQLLPELAFNGLDLLLLDHAWAHESPEVLAKISLTLGCAICFGSVKEWWQRVAIERSFLETARATHGAPSSVGSSPKEERREDAGQKAIRYRVRSGDLFDLICDEARASLKRRGEGTFFVPSLELLDRHVRDVRSLWVPRPLPRERRAEYPLDWIDIATKIVAGSRRDPTSHAPHLRVQGVRFHGTELAEEWCSVGEKVLLQVSRDDFRRARVVHTGTGRLIGPAMPEAKWNRHALRWREVLLIFREGRKARRLEEVHDPAVAFAQAQTAKLKEHTSSKRGRARPHDAARKIANMPESVLSAAAAGAATSVNASGRYESSRGEVEDVPDRESLVPHALPEGFGIQPQDWESHDGTQ